MTNPSDAAYAVFTAYNREASGKPEDHHMLEAIAATLRAAAECSCEEQDEPPQGPYEQGYLDAIEWVFKRMNAIADDLEEFGR